MPSEGISLNMDHEKTSVMAIGHSLKSPAFITLQITLDIYINGFFKLLFYLTPYHTPLEAHTSHPENGNIRIELHFNRPLPEAITCLLYLEYDSTVLINFSRSHNRFLMDTW